MHYMRLFFPLIDGVAYDFHFDVGIYDVTEAFPFWLRNVLAADHLDFEETSPGTRTGDGP